MGHTALREMALCGFSNTTDLESLRGYEEGYVKMTLTCGPKCNLNWLILDFTRASLWQAILGQYFPDFVLGTEDHVEADLNLEKRLKARAKAVGIGKIIPTDFDHMF